MSKDYSTMLDRLLDGKSLTEAESYGLMNSLAVYP